MQSHLACVGAAPVGGEIKLHNEVIAIPAFRAGYAGGIYGSSVDPSEGVLDVIGNIKALRSVGIDCKDVKLSGVSSALVGNGYELTR